MNDRKLKVPLHPKVWRVLALLLAAIPIAAYPLSLSDYLNQSTVTASADQFESITSNNTDQIQIIPNAELVVVKQVTNDNGGALSLSDFNVTSSAGALAFDSGVTTGDTTTFTSSTLYVPPGTYTLAEDDLDGYAEGAWSCTVGTMGTTLFSGGEVSLTFGQQTVCTITNDDIAPTLMLTKTLVNDNGGLKTIADFDISIDSTEVTSGVANTVLANTALSISELDLPGYTTGTWSCVDSAGLTTGLPTAGVATGESITLQPGSAVNCSISNDDIAPTLTLAKTLDNGDGGLLTIADFDISIDSAEVTSGVANTVSANVAMTISELDMPGYTEGAWSCVDANSLTTGLPTAGLATGVPVTLAPGSAVTCSIVNDDVAPQLTLVKTLNNTYGGDLAIADFDISIDSVEVTSGAANSVLANQLITISELDMPGYTEGSWSCVDANSLTTGLPSAGLATGQGLTLAAGADVTCSIVNDDIAPKLTLAKTIINLDGGDLVVDDFDISVDGTEVTNNVAVNVLANTAITISELEIPGYTAGTWACTDANSLTTGLPSTGAASGVSISLKQGSDVTCAISNDDIAPVLTLNKTVVNTAGGSLGIDDFDISVDGTEVISGTATTVAANTSITISELDKAGYTEGTWECIDATTLTTGLPSAGLATGVDITLKPGSDVSCSITNNDVAPLLTLSKTVINGDGGDLGVTDFDISIDGVEVVTSVPNAVQSNTNITIAELDLPGYTEGAWSCVDANSLASGLPSAGLATGVTFSLPEGADVTCSISNDDIAPTLALSKTVVNNDGGDLGIADFDISIDATEVGDGVATNVQANTPIVISELLMPGYTAGTWSCSDSTGLTTTLPSAGAAAGESITLKQGSVVSCAITNDDIAPLLTLSKTVDNSDGGDLTIDDFDISVDGSEVISGVASTVLANSSITISELDLPGYTEGTWSCVDANSLTTGLPTAGAAGGEALSLKQGSDVTCSIVNDDIAPQLTLSKQVINLDGGDLGVADFDISIDGVEVTDSVANAVLANTAITISELDMPGYTEGAWSCVDTSGLTSGLPTAGLATGESITLQQGADVTCSIVNDDIAPQLTLVKTVQNDNGGSLSIDDFDISINGVEVTSGLATTQLANTIITISELDLVPYAEGTWSCVDANSLTSGLPTAGIATSTSLALKQGADVTCSITNNDLGIDLSIVKAVDDSTPNIGQTITFWLTVENAGPDTATGVTVSDVVPAGFTYVAGSITGGSSSNDSDPTVTGLSWTISSVPVGTPFVLSFDAVVGAP